ncbi:MAG: succinate dehydrogenase iron-sulfur subunit [Gammaproteobacteria bacterium]|nr:succinate dehydrogenase iron-sulfur subunit [Gammaproteobacteria bacterium]
MNVRIYRYNPEIDDAPWLQDHDFEPPGERDLMVLDVLESLKERDPTLTFRRSCREGVCGSDGMNINGANSLACITRVSTVMQGGALPSGQPLGASDTLTIRPLPGMPVIRDLVVDMDLFWKQYESVKPWLINADAPPEQERLQSRRSESGSTASTSASSAAAARPPAPPGGGTRRPDVGPAGLLGSYRFLADSRDTATAERLADLDDAYRLFRCRGVLNCVAFCPRQLNPRSAIARTQMMLVKGNPDGSTCCPTSGSGRRHATPRTSFRVCWTSTKGIGICRSRALASFAEI